MGFVCLRHKGGLKFEDGDSKEEVAEVEVVPPSKKLDPDDQLVHVMSRYPIPRRISTPTCKHK